MSDSQRFMRCPARNTTKARELDEKLGRKVHMQQGHVCKECRCNRVAGENTKGDYYGIGFDTGHYGVGWCKLHEMGIRRKRFAEKFARTSMDALVSTGRTRSEELGEFVDVVHQDAEVYSHVKEIFKATDLVRTQLENFKDLCQSDDLTETGKFGPTKASDETRIRLALDVAKTIAIITKTDLDISSKRMIPIEEVVMRVKMMMDLARRYIPDPREQVRFFEEFKEIWVSVIKKGSPLNGNG